MALRQSSPMPLDNLREVMPLTTYRGFENGAAAAIKKNTRRVNRINSFR